VELEWKAEMIVATGLPDQLVDGRLKVMVQLGKVGAVIQRVVMGLDVNVETSALSKVGALFEGSLGKVPDSGFSLAEGKRRLKNVLVTVRQGAVCFLVPSFRNLEFVVVPFPRVIFQLNSDEPAGAYAWDRFNGVFVRHDSIIWNYPIFVNKNLLLWLEGLKNFVPVNFAGRDLFEVGVVFADV
jgi:hypothetical protein